VAVGANSRLRGHECGRVGYAIVGGRHVGSIVSLGRQHSYACDDHCCPWGVPTVGHVPRVLHRMASWSGDIRMISLMDFLHGPPITAGALKGSYGAERKMWPDDNGDMVPTRAPTTSPKAAYCCSPPRPPLPLCLPCDRRQGVGQQMSPGQRQGYTAFAVSTQP